MKKLVYSIIFAFFCCSFAKAQNGPIKNIKWYLPKDYISHIMFFDESYDIIFSVGGYYCSGKYTYNDNKITLFYPEIDKPIFELGKAMLDYLFQDKDKAELVYDAQYSDFDCIGCIRNDKVVLRNLGNESPSGQIYTIQGVPVIKYNQRESMVLILENLRMRELPDVNSGLVRLNIFLTGIDQSFTSNVIHKDSINNFDAKTIREDTIDGITAPWYRVSVTLGETFSEDVWVFGGYLRELERSEIENPEKQRSFWQKYYNTLFDLKVISRNPGY